MIKAVIFDMDGLLINSEPLWFKARREFFKRYDAVWTEEDQITNMGVSTKAWASYMAEKLNHKLSEEKIVQAIVEKMKTYYGTGKLEVMTGADEALKYSSGKFKTGLASGSYKELLFKAIKSNQWEKYFDEILSSDDLEKGKPDPLIYIETSKRLGVEPGESVVVEDSNDGIRAGIDAGAKVIAVPNKKENLPEDLKNKSAAVIDSLKEFTIALEKIVNSE